MSIVEYSNRHVMDLVAYEPGKPIEETAREIGMPPEQIIKLASNENPLGPSKKALAAIEAMLPESHIYPDGAAFELRSLLAKKFDLGFEQVVIGNGSNEIIELLCHCFLNPQSSLIAAEHAFVVYKLMTTLFGAKYIPVADPGFKHDLYAMAKAIRPDTRLVFIANPNNPTGTMIAQSEFDAFMRDVPPHVVVAVDEAYIEFPDNPADTLRYVHEGRNVCVLRTCSKIHGLAGLRCGYGLTTPAIAGLLHKARQPFNVNALAQTAAIAALSDDEHVQATRQLNAEGLAYLYSQFEALGLEYVDSHANFVLVKTGNAAKNFNDLLQKGVIIRSMQSYGLPEWVRVTVGTMPQNERFIEALKQVLA